MNEDLESRVQNIIDDLDENNHKERGLIRKSLGIVPAVYLGGCFLRRYQKRIAEKLEWKESTLTIANATLFTLIGLTIDSSGNSLFGEETNLLKKISEIYSAFLLIQNPPRAIYSYITGKAIGSLSIPNLLGSSAYAITDFVKKRRE